MFGFFFICPQFNGKCTELNFIEISHGLMLKFMRINLGAYNSLVKNKLKLVLLPYFEYFKLKLNPKKVSTNRENLCVGFFPHKTLIFKNSFLILSNDSH